MSEILGLWAAAVWVAVMMLLAITQYSWLWRYERLMAESTAGLLVASLPFIAIMPLSWPTKLGVLLVHLWLLVLPARLIYGRLQKVFIRRSTQINAIIGLVLAMIILLGAEFVREYPDAIPYETRLIGLGVLAVGVAGAFLAQLLWTFKHFRMPPPPPISGQPTVSLCIPARNETHALTECLMAAVASNYPKLEILVLDDCSQDTTSQIIRSFAHDGVRFVQGEVPAEGWLGKNQAMQTLASQAVGDYIIFMSVDTRLAPGSVTTMLNYALANDLQMMSVWPQVRGKLGLATLFGTLETFWQAVLPITRRRVPTSSKCWLINTAVLHSLGGFASVKYKILPEGSFARRLLAKNTYRFIVSDAALGMTSSKRWTSQAETAVRILYPTFKRQPFYVLFGVLCGMALLVFPFIATIMYGILGVVSAVFWLSLTASCLLLICYALVLSRVQPVLWFWSFWFFPAVLLQEIGLTVLSMLKYEFGEVTWKGRNVCYPVMGGIPSAAKPAGGPPPPVAGRQTGS